MGPEAQQTFHAQFRKVDTTLEKTKIAVENYLTRRINMQFKVLKKA